MSKHICALTCYNRVVTIYLCRNVCICLATIIRVRELMCLGTKRVWAQKSCMGLIVWAQSCLGTIMSGHKRVWAQSCLGTIVSGHNHVWAQSCLGTNVCGHKRVWAQTWWNRGWRESWTSWYIYIYIYKHKNLQFNFNLIVINNNDQTLNICIIVSKLLKKILADTS